jgi:hypothetical protein
VADTSKRAPIVPMPPVPGSPLGEDVAKDLRANDLLQFKVDISSAAEEAEELHGALKALEDDWWNTPLLGASDHAALRSAREAMAAVSQVLILIASRVRMEVSHE